MQNRRDFLKTSGAAAAGLTILSNGLMGQNAPSRKINVAGIGVGGMGKKNLERLGDGANIVALCDVDLDHAAEVFKTYPDAKVYQDYRVMLEMQKDIEAVLIATPDHTHAVIALDAIAMGKHVYVQKPLAQSINEIRALTEAAAKSKVIHQMGNQGHSGLGWHMMDEWYEDGILGEVREVHCWTNRPVWPQGMRMPREAHLIPEGLDWDSWLGPAAMRDYSPLYHPFAWRGFYDFGTGALGDMGCHLIDAAFSVLKLGAPESIEAVNSKRKEISGFEEELANAAVFPDATLVRFRFPARGNKPPVVLNWYDGGLRPWESVFPDFRGKKKPGKSGGLMIGSNASVMHGTYGEEPVLSPIDLMREVPRKPQRHQVDPAGASSHEKNWLAAIRGEEKAKSSFDYAGPFTEAVMLGNLAVRHPGKQLLWDAKAMKVTNLESANELLSPPRRRGWELRK